MSAAGNRLTDQQRDMLRFMGETARYSVAMEAGQFKALLAEMGEKDTEISRLRSAVRRARAELAAIIPVPSAPSHDAWPMKNPADRECAQAAYVILTDALGDPA